MVRSVQRWRDFSVCVERFGADGFRDGVLRGLVILLKSSTCTTRLTGWTTVPVSALDVNKPDMGMSLFVRRGDLCEGGALSRRIDVTAHRL